MKKLNLIGQVFNKLTVIEEADNLNGLTAWKCQCECGNKCIATTKQLRNGNKKSCGCLKATSKPINIGDKFNKLTVISYIVDRPHYVLCQCECGNYTEVYEYNLKSNQVKSCGCLRHQPSERRRDLTNQKFGYLTALYLNTKISKPNATYWHCICDCGQEVDILLNNLVKEDRNPSCGCQTKRSLGEEKIKEILQNNNIEFVREKTFDDCINPKTNTKLRFDFYVNNEYLIEYNGKQHYGENSSGWNDSLEDIQYRDQLKIEWAKKHNIPLIIIPYTEYNKITLDMLLP